MQTVRMFYSSSYGDFYIPCEVIGQDEEGDYVVRFLDPFSLLPCEELIGEKQLIVVEQRIERDYLLKVSHRLAEQFKKDLLLLDEEQLQEIANVVLDALEKHFKNDRT